MVLNLFYVFYPFIKRDYQIYHQYTQWRSFIKNTKLNKLPVKNDLQKFTFVAIYGSVNLHPWKMKFTPRLRTTTLDPGVRNSTMTFSLKHTAFWITIILLIFVYRPKIAHFLVKTAAGRAVRTVDTPV